MPRNIFPIDNVEVGDYSYGDLTVRCFHDCNYKLKIGAYCSIASNVVFLLCAEHDTRRILTYPINTYFFGDGETGKISKGDIVIKDDVWIGENCTILSGVTIGQGAIIASGSIVAKDVPDYAIYGDFRILGYRFDEEVRRRLTKFEVSHFDKAFVENNKCLFSCDVTNEIIDQLVKVQNNGI